MQAAKRGSQTVITVPAMGNLRSLTDNPLRVGLIIQVTGSNPGRIRFGNDVGYNGGDRVIAANDTLELRDSPPTDAVNFGSVLGTTFSVLEEIEARNERR